MPVVTLPDGSSRQFDNAITVYDVAAEIGAGLAKATLAGVVDGREVDASYSIESDSDVFSPKRVCIKTVFLQSMCNDQCTLALSRCEKVVQCRLVIRVLSQQTQSVFERMQNHGKQMGVL